MRKLSGYYASIRKLTDGQIEKWSAKLIQILNQVLKAECKLVRDHVENIKRFNPSLTTHELADNIISRRS